MRCISIEEAQSHMGEIVQCTKLTGRDFAAKLIGIENEDSILVFEIKSGAILRDARVSILLMKAVV